MGFAFKIIPVVEVRCGRCAGIFKAYENHGNHKQQVCYDCHEADLKKEITKEKENAFRKLCPPAMAATQLEKLPAWADNEASVRKALAWVPTAEKPFLILHGVTGRGKSRLMWQVLRRLAVEHGMPPLYFAAGELSPAVSAAWADMRAAALVESIKRAKVLAFDDLDKDRLSPKAEETLFAAISHRADYGKPTIITTNLTGEPLVARMSAEMGTALLRRLREFSVTISP
jgi:DNA replication protein DnaC